MIRPIRYWNGVPVPFLTAWSGEDPPPQALTVRHGRQVSGLGFRDEDPAVDRQLNVLWMRMPAVPGVGEPRWDTVHALRQRQTMTRSRCQVCGGGVLDARADQRLLFLFGASADRHPIGDGERTSSPPLHATCAQLAVQHCPFLRRGWVAALVGYTVDWGVAGTVYDPETLTPLTGRVDEVRYFSDPVALRWVLAARLIVTLHEIDPVTDLDALAAGERARIEARQASR
ncbi:hypothetical protein ACIO13_07005 [Streptomyces sp. NPDC087425]|uniref:hypothetical protein n=1 Tax=Streptomyces sp. NPDC087425 TaxID=3365787 RepID=UPI0037F8A4D2